MRSSYAVSLTRHKVHNPGDNPLGQKCGQLAHFHNSYFLSYFLEWENWRRKGKMCVKYRWINLTLQNERKAKFVLNLLV